MNPYYLFWAILIVASLWVSLGGFLWAHRHGQFKDQDRARFIALRDEAGPPATLKAGGARHEAFVMIAILTMGISAILFVLAIVLTKGAGGSI
jgi:cbb3-type cytochrome oxidase maturation protein